MKKFIMKYGHIFTALAVVVTAYSANRCCAYFYHQPKLPASAKKLRKF